MCMCVPGFLQNHLRFGNLPYCCYSATWTKREGQRVGIPIIWLFPDKRFGSDVSNTYNLHRKVAHCIGFQIKTQYMYRRATWISNAGSCQDDQNGHKGRHKHGSMPKCPIIDFLIHFLIKTTTLTYDGPCPIHPSAYDPGADFFKSSCLFFSAS